MGQTPAWGCEAAWGSSQLCWARQHHWRNFSPWAYQGRERDAAPLANCRRPACRTRLNRAPPKKVSANVTGLSSWTRVQVGEGSLTSGSS